MERNFFTFKIYLCNGTYKSINIQVKNSVWNLSELVRIAIGLPQPSFLSLKPYGLKLYKKSQINFDKIFVDKKSERYCENELIYHDDYSNSILFCCNNIESNSYWLHNELMLEEMLTDNFIKSLHNDSIKLFFRLRVFSYQLKDLIYTDKLSFDFLWNQIKFDYLCDDQLNNIPLDIISYLSALLQKQYLSSSLIQINPKTKNDLTNDKLVKIIPLSLIPTIKYKEFKKFYAKSLKSVSDLVTNECMKNFYTTLSNYKTYDYEIFPICIGSFWSTVVDIVISPSKGLCLYTNYINKENGWTIDFNQIYSLTIDIINHQNKVYPICIHVANVSESLNIFAQSFVHLLQIAFLVDSYAMVAKKLELTLITSFIGNKAISHSNQDMNDEFIYDFPKTNEWNFKHKETFEKINWSSIKLNKLLGEGQFGSVHSATIQSKGGCFEVAIKLKKDVEDQQLDALHHKEFVDESELMKKLDHENIISICGMIEKPTAIIMELASNGQLKGYLQNKKNQLAFDELFSYCSQLSYAVQYLSQKNFIHRDIACRNLLLFDNNVIKLSDFGLARELDESKIFKANKGKMPIKWMAPESLNSFIFSLASDIWMMGICMWEIFSYGQKPFAEILNKDLVNHLTMGGRPNHISYIPRVFNEILYMCWYFDPRKRLNIDSFIDKMKKTSECLTTKSFICSPNNFEPKTSIGFKEPVSLVSKPSVTNLMETQSKSSQNITTDSPKNHDSISTVVSNMSNLQLQNNLITNEEPEKDYIYEKSCSNEIEAQNYWKKEILKSQNDEENKNEIEISSLPTKIHNENESINCVNKMEVNIHLKDCTCKELMNKISEVINDANHFLKNNMLLDFKIKMKKIRDFTNECRQIIKNYEVILFQNDLSNNPKFSSPKDYLIENLMQIINILKDILKNGTEFIGLQPFYIEIFKINKYAQEIVNLIEHIHSCQTN